MSYKSLYGNVRSTLNVQSSVQLKNVSRIKRSWYTKTCFAMAFQPFSLFFAFIFYNLYKSDIKLECDYANDF